MISRRGRTGLVLAGLLVLVTASVVVWSPWDGDGRYGHALVRYSDEDGEPNVYVDLGHREAQLAVGSPDGHRVVVQWRDPAGGSWTEPQTVWEDRRRTTVDSTVRFGGGTVAVLHTYTSDVHSDDDDVVRVAVVCRELACTAAPAPGQSGAAQVTPDGSTAYLGADQDGVLVWREGGGLVREPWSGHPGFRGVSTSAPVLAPDGSLRVVAARPAREACRFTLFASSPGGADLARVASSTQPLRGPAVSGCSSYLHTWSADWVEVNPNDHRAPRFWFVRGDDDSWSPTRRDASGLAPVDVDRGCCDTLISEFVHWNDVAYGTHHGRSIVVQTHLLGDETWGAPTRLRGAPAGHRCSSLTGHEVGEAGFVVVLSCRGGSTAGGGVAHAIAASPDLRTWDVRFVADARGRPVIAEDSVRVGRTTWTPDGGFVTD